MFSWRSGNSRQSEIIRFLNRREIRFTKCNCVALLVYFGCILLLLLVPTLSTKNRVSFPFLFVCFCFPPAFPTALERSAVSCCVPLFIFRAVTSALHSSYMWLVRRRQARDWSAVVAVAACVEAVESRREGGLL